MNKNTTITKTEYLSAFLDDEAGTFEQRRMLDETQKDNDLQKKVAHFSLIGEAMRNENSSVTVQANFLAGLHEKLDEEPVYQNVRVKKVASSSAKSWFNPVAGMAIAASLAAITVVALNMNTGTNTTTSTVLASSDTNTKPDVVLASVNVTEAAEPVGTKEVLSEPDMAWRKRLKKYVNSHVRYASTSAIMPTIRAASYVSSY